jgi:hypothetical protein
VERDGGTERAAGGYRFGPLERRGLVAGWRGGQIAAVAASLVVAVLALRALSTGPGLAVAIAVVALGVGIATWPIGGRTVEEWTPDAVRHLTRPRGRRPIGAGRVFDTVSILEPSLDGSATRASVGVVHDRATHTFTAVLPASGPGFVLLGRDDQAGRVNAWAGVLSSLARQGGLVHRLQWVERSLPDGGAELRRHFDRRAVVGAETPVARSYAALLAGESLVAQRHEVLLAVTVHAGHGSRAVRAAGGGEAGACTVLLREVATLCRRLGEAGIAAGAVLGPGSLAAAIRRGYDADATMRAWAGSELRTPSAPWPMAVAAEWDRVQVDGTWHATYWVAEWPRTDVVPDFLGPLLLLSDVRRSVSVVMEPMSPLRAARQAEQARTADIADAELRRRGGFLATARRRREEEIVAHRETELADGHAQYRFTGYVTVTVEDPGALDDACGQAEQAAAMAGLELRRCYGDQLRAFACTMPLGRGLS